MKLVKAAKRCNQFNMLLQKNGIVIDSWEESREYTGFLTEVKDKARDGGVIILSRARSAASSTILRDHIPRSFLADSGVLSTSRLKRLIERKVTCDRPRFGLIPSNGSGLGHVTRMQAFAQALENYGPVAFMSFSAVLTSGAFYLPSPQYLELNDEDARVYVRESALRFFNRFDPTHIIYDGNVIPSGLLSALAMRPEIHLTWVRRGHWAGDTAEKYMAQQALADLVIEPGDISDTYDTGPSWSRRGDFCPPQGFLKTQPIRNPQSDVLPRSQALKALGLKDRKYILLMPGVLKEEDIDLVNSCVDAIKRTGAMPVLAHWPVAQAKPPEIEDLIVIESMPIAPYFAAFEAIISAAGYNAFHEIIASGQKCVFIPQEDAGRDCQPARARFAAEHGLAAFCRRCELHHLRQILETLQVPAPFRIGWMSDWSPVVQAMGVIKGSPASVEVPGRGMSNVRLFKTLHRRFLKSHRAYRTNFILALDIGTKSFLKRKIDRSAIIVTNSIDPVALRRAGYKYLWLNDMSHRALMRQIWNWLRVWRPERIRSI